MVWENGFSWKTALPAQGRDGDRGVPVVGRRNDDRVHVVAAQDTGIILVDVGGGAKLVTDCLGPRAMHVGQGHDAAVPPEVIPAQLGNFGHG